MFKIFTILLFVLIETVCSHAQSATWTGAVDNNWNNSANWTWTGGEGLLPTAATDVFISDDMISPNIIAGNTAYCYNIYGSNSVITLTDNATLKIYGNLLPDLGGYPIAVVGHSDDGVLGLKKGKIQFLGNSDQYVFNAVIACGKVEIFKTGGNLILSGNTNQSIQVYDSLIFKNEAVALGSAPLGNILIKKGMLALHYDANVSMPSFTDVQIPPHIAFDYEIMTSPEDAWISYENIIFDSEEGGVNGAILFPVGTSLYSYNPVQITEMGEGGSFWYLRIYDTIPPACTGYPFLATEVVKALWNIQSSGEPNSGEITFTYNKNNIGSDVSELFELTSNQGINIKNESECIYIQENVYTELDGNWVHVTLDTLMEHNDYFISQYQQLVVSTQDDVPAIITEMGGTLQMEARYTAPEVTGIIFWNIIPVTGDANISFDGLVTGVSNGTVYAKAYSLKYPWAIDSMLIHIHFQTSILENEINNGAFNVFPNPSNDNISFSIPEDFTDGSIYIYDVSGRVVYTSTFSNVKDQPLYSIDISKFKKGSYILKLSSIYQTLTRQFVKLN